MQKMIQVKEDAMMPQHEKREVMKKVSFVTIIVLLTTPFLASAQSAPDGRTLSIAGQSESAKVLEVNGKSYVEVEDVARLIRGSLTFQANRILLTLPAEFGRPSAAAPSAKPGFSKEFLQAAIEQLSALREWRITIVNSIQNNSPVSPEWVAELQRKVQTNLALAGTARSTADDRHGYPLLAAEFANLQKLSNHFLSQRKQLQYIDPGSIENDPLDQQIRACGHGLAAMMSENQFREEPACQEAH
jgi:hypothetical protein